MARLPAHPARHRMALWREVRRSGAIALGQAVWAVPDLPAVRPLLERLADLVEAARGTLLVLAAKGFADGDVARPPVRRNGPSSTPTVASTRLNWTRRSGSVSTHSASSRKRSKALIGYAAGIESYGAAICLRFGQQRTRPQR
jgi:hypothetical protein